MRYHLVCRSSPGENRKGRPWFYSKAGALASLLNAVTELPPGDRIFVNDGEMPEPRASRIAAAGEVIELGGVGNARSYRACIALVDSRVWDDDDVVYFAEDDYLYLEDAFARLVEAVEALPESSYFTLYDHPDYYRSRSQTRFMARHRSARAVGDIRWREVRSTCLTYAARVGALRSDSWAHYLCTRGPTPDDFPLWSIVEDAGCFPLHRLLKASPAPYGQSLAKHNLARLTRGKSRHRLYAPTPSLVTHVEDAMLAPGRDWSLVAAAYDLETA